MNTSISRQKFPLILSGAIALVVIVWMLSGMFSHSESSTPANGAGATQSQALPQVRVQQMTAATVTREIVVSGRTEPNRTLELRTEAEGTVSSLGSARGAVVKAGALVAKLDTRDRPARLHEAEALVSQRELEYAGIQSLNTRQFTTPVQIADAKSKLESAKAVVERIKLEITHTTLVAPFDAVLQDRVIELGDFVRVGDKVAELVDLDPIIISGEVNEHEIAKLAVGGKGVAITVDGKRHEGTVRYLAPKANSNTRTFLIELAVPNPDNSIRAGMTAELRLFADTVNVHNISAALLSLADDGTIGIKVVDAANTVHFHPATIVGAADGGLQQISGLPDSINLITVGQAFVKDGQKVNAVTAASMPGNSKP